MPVLKLIKILAIPLIASYLLACAKQANRLENLTPSCVFPNKQVAPGWICGKAVTGVTIQAVGVVDKSVAGHNYMRDMARIAAVKQLSEVFKDYSAKAIIRYLTLIKAPRADAIKAGASTIKVISSATLAGAQQYRYEIGPEGRGYMLLGLDRKSSNDLLESTLKADQTLWLKYKGNKSFADLAADIAKIGHQQN